MNALTFRTGMRRALLLSALTLLAFAAVAFAAGSAKLTVRPNTPGAGSVSTLDAVPPNQSKTPRSVALKVVKGVKFHGRAAAKRCSDAQAKQNSCPAGSRIGGGKIDANATGFGPVQVDVSLFLAPKRRATDLAGLVGIADAAGQKGHAFGRLFRINQGKLGLETFFGGLDKAIKPPPGVKVKVTHLRLHFGKHRQVNGERVDLITNPSTCPDKGWPYAASVTYPDGTGKTFSHAVQCIKPVR
jgi:hypothetical protein